MNWDRIQGQWKQVMGMAKQRWGELSFDDLVVIAGHRDQLAGMIQQRYGLAREEANQQVSEWGRNASDAWFVTGRYRI